MNQDNDEPIVLPFPLDRIARARTDCDDTEETDGNAPTILPFCPLGSANSRPVA